MYFVKYDCLNYLFNTIFNTRLHHCSTSPLVDRIINVSKNIYFPIIYLYRWVVSLRGKNEMEEQNRKKNLTTT